MEISIYRKKKFGAGENHICDGSQHGTVLEWKRKEKTIQFCGRGGEDDIITVETTTKEVKDVS